MSIGESGLTVVFVVTAFLCMIGAAKALDSAFAFHASLSAVASLAAAFVILNRYFDRPASLPAAEINNLGHRVRAPVPRARCPLQASPAGRGKRRSGSRLQGAAADERKLGPFTCECEGTGATDTAARAGDNRDFTFQARAHDRDS